MPKVCAEGQGKVTKRVTGTFSEGRGADGRLERLNFLINRSLENVLPQNIVSPSVLKLISNQIPIHIEVLVKNYGYFE